MDDDALCEILEGMSRTFAYAVRRDELARAAVRIAALADELRAAKLRAERLERELRVLVERCDGAEGVRADGSNIDTRAAHAVLPHG